MDNSEDVLFKNDSYILNLPYHLAEAGMSTQLIELLTEFYFIECKLLERSTQSLIQDYGLALREESSLSKQARSELRLIQKAIQLSASILEEDKTQIAGQLLGRLMRYEQPGIKKITKQAKQWKVTPWLRPLTASLVQPTYPLLRTLLGHTKGL